MGTVGRIEAWYNPHRSDSYTNMLSPIDYENANAAYSTPPTRPPHGGKLNVRRQ